ncbi:L-aminoadipate-semialdehyde dehydrogenase-phosphopantetheinyl transferase [Leguminivora glycinivorella]|uniref:L-aminoadipate-semialdehyde dehydrogenase-phosphopantetheinyl transferase n=1 Tax=Leguminivora glycinivorella TaxID=1035111 RepID=UPI00200D1330|nr:L-aminoadipate-semialdehyde dehydrogenase-phosphopantetheinyl transferase [Leguminivora glycinivorella]
MLNYMVHKLTKNNLRTTLNFAQRHYITYKPKMADYNVRWAFNIITWKPTYEEILSASSYIQLEEKERLDRFVYQDDVKSSLIGRLMMRKFIHISTGIPYNELTFARDERGKPYLVGAGDVPINFNVSHQGDYSVLAGHKERNIGIDVMKVEPPVNKNVPEFFRLMTKQFSAHEWRTIKGYRTEKEQLKCFYRHWCLKEAYVKNIGVGLTIALNKITFVINTFDMSVGDIVTDTQLYVNDVLKRDWKIEETLLDEKHGVAVAIQVPKDYVTEPVSYSYLNFEELVKEAQPLNPPDQTFANSFLKKSMKPF